MDTNEEDAFLAGDEADGGGDTLTADVPAVSLPANTPVAAPHGTGINALPPGWWEQQAAPPAPDYGRINALRDLYNKVPTKEANQAVEMATRLEGILGMDADIRAGVSTVEALRKWAPKLYFNHPGAVSRLVQPPFQPGVTNVEGNKLIQTSPNRYQLLPVPPATETGDIPLRPLTTPEGKILGYGAATKSGLHPKWNTAEVPEVKVSDEIRRLTALAKGYEQAAVTAASNEEAAGFNKKKIEALSALEKINGRKASAVVATPPSGGPPVITTKEQYDALPHGAIYLNGKSNKKHQKP